MELFAPRATVERLERQAAAGGAGRFAALVELAWHLRQRDTPRAQALAREAAGLAAATEPPALLAARLRLVEADCANLLGHLDAAEGLAADAAARFAALGDAPGIGDAALVRARIAEARGQRDAELPRYREAIAAYERAGDLERLAHARAASMLANEFGDPAAMAAALAQLRGDAAGLSPAVQAQLRFLEGVAAFQRGAFLEAVPALRAAALDTFDEGLCEQGFRAEAGLVSALSNLGDREAACLQAEALLGRARALHWPRSIGHALANFARQLAETGEHQRAVELLLEARATLAGEPRSRGYGIACYYLGDAYLALGRHAEAFAELDRARAIMRDLGAQPEVACLMAIAAQALSRMGRAAEAADSARGALELARKTRSRLWEVEALRSLAEVHARHHPSGDAARDAAEALALLREALGVVEAIGGHHEKAELLTEVARAHEVAGDFPAALAAERAARAEEASQERRRAANRILLARERHEAERQRIEAELQRERAATEAERARTLESTLELLEHLRQVGQDITSNLEPAGMLQALDRHLGRLADVSFIGVFVFDPEGGKLARHGIERGRLLPVGELPIADLESYAARAARERREIHVDQPEGGPLAARIPGTRPTGTLWFGPLLVKDDLLGVLTVQAAAAGAYGKREQLIFRTVSSHAAVAIANARIHGELEDKHRRLVETEAEMRRLATIDALTGLANRRRFLDGARSEVARAMRYGGPVGVVMADLDRFKAINDARGHGGGDRLLAAVASILRTHRRPHDVVGRLGGEEFGLVLPGADLEDTASAAERIRCAVESLALDYEGARLAATISLGCAAVPEARSLAGGPAEALAVLLRQADAALYEAKRLGRNRVHTAGPPEASSAA